MATKLVSWNINKLSEAWKALPSFDADVALLQEVGTNWMPPPGVEVGPREHWDAHAWLPPPAEFGHERWYDRWSMVVKLSDRVEVEWLRQVPPIDHVGHDEFAVSGIGTAAAARVIPHEGDPFVVVSMYGRWMGQFTQPKWIYPDGSVHRVISDLSAFAGSYDPGKHRIVAAGDLNVSFRSSDRFDARAQTILDRMVALGLEYMGPIHPNGRRAEPIPSHLTEASLDVPTYYTRKRNWATAHVQVDHVFASRGLHKDVRTRALNQTKKEWGPSDHCPIVIEVGTAVR